MRTKLLIILILIVMACKKTPSTDNKKDTASIDSLYSLLDYPKWKHCDSIESEFGAYYPALKLDRVTLDKVKTIFGEPDEEFVDFTSTLSGKEPPDEMYFIDLVKKLPDIKIYVGKWYLDNDFTLTLYFFYDGDSLRTFYGYKMIPGMYIFN